MQSFFSGLKTLFKKYFVAGALVFIPIVGTIWILKTLILWTDGFLTSIIPQRLQPEALIGWHIPGLGLVITFSLILLVGVLTRVYIGKKLLDWGDAIIRKIPFGRGIYSAIKQFMSTVVSQNSSSFKQAVLVEFPTHGSWMIGFVTGSSSPDENSKDDLTNVFIPTAPNPTSGFLVFVQNEKLKPINMSVDRAFRTIISVGVVSKDDNEILQTLQEDKKS